MNTEFAAIAKAYKRTVASTFMLVDGAALKEKLTGEDFLVTKKIDGAMTILFYRDGAVEAYTSNGIERPMLPCFEEFADLCGTAGLKSATVAAELYAVISATGRERVGDVSTAIADSELQGKLRLAPFNILDLEGERVQTEHYREMLDMLNKYFSGTLVAPVEGRSGSKSDVMEAYQEWVVDGGAEGLVVHSELPIVQKVKPRHSIDAVVVGYSLSEEGGIRALMVAVMTPEGKLQPFATVGGGFTDQQRLDFITKLEPLACESEFVETDSRNVAYKMVRPEMVLEMTIIDLVSEDSKGAAKINPLLTYNSEEGYLLAAQTPGVAVYSPVFIRLRDDKTACPSDIRISQLTDLCPFAEQKPVVLSGLPQSEILMRRIFVKGEGPKRMIQKYVVWKTNKEQTGAFPAYVFHFTDFSASRAEVLKRDIRVSSSREQILQLTEDYIAEKVKKGWSEYQD